MRSVSFKKIVSAALAAIPVFDVAVMSAGSSHRRVMFHSRMLAADDYFQYLSGDCLVVVIRIHGIGAQPVCAFLLRRPCAGP